MQILAPIGFPSSPSVARLRQWSILELVDDANQVVHVAVGLFNDSDSRVRVTSPIEQFEGGQIVTASRSIYALTGPSATQEQLHAQAGRRQALLGWRPATEVTDRYVRR